VVGKQSFRGWRWRQRAPSKRWYPTTLLLGVTSRKTTSCIHMTYLTFITTLHFWQLTAW